MQKRHLKFKVKFQFSFDSFIWLLEMFEKTFIETNKFNTSLTKNRCYGISIEECRAIMT